MKLAFLSVILFLGAQSMACDQLIGTWKCTIQDTGSVTTDTYQKNADGALVMTSVPVPDDGQNHFSMIVDGKSHQEKSTNEGADMEMTYTATLACNGNSAVLDMKATAVLSDGNTALAQSDAVSKGTYTFNGNQLTLVTNMTQKVTQQGQVSNQSDSNTETCVKQ